MKSNRLVFLACILIVFSGIRGQYLRWRMYSDDQLHVFFFNQGNGDATLVKTPDQRIFLVDGGPRDDFTYAIGEVLPFWVNDIDAVIVSHSHIDHITGLIGVFRDYRVRCVMYDMRDIPISSTEMMFRESVRAEGAIVFESVKIPSSNCFGSAVRIESYQAFPPSDNQKENENDETIIVKMIYKDFDVLFTGDAETPLQEKYVHDVASSDIEVIKVPHQGSRDSFYAPFLDHTKPNIAIAFVGKNNPYGHPHGETLKGYELMSIPFYRTDDSGTIHVKSTGVSAEIEIECRCLAQAIRL